MRRSLASPGLVAFLALALPGCSPRPPAAPAPLAADPATLRSLPAGDVVGGKGLHGGHAWLGIPFAQPPVGALRWRAPQPLARWDGLREALAFGSACPQFASPIAGAPGERGEIVGTEDCLYLNVYAPAFDADDVPGEGGRLPVMVWIYGGGNSIGATSGYDGSALATRQDVVVVTVAYRLGALGWFRHASLRRECAAAEAACLDDASGNFGTLDQIRALTWVRDNIAAFGGDPANVTIFGESAGARNVLALLASPRAKGLFHRAISQSGGTRSSSFAEAEHLTTDAEPGAPTSSAEIVRKLGIESTALRDVPAETLLRAYDGGGSPMYFAPQLFPDGAVLSAEEPLAAIRAGRHNSVPVLLGTNKDEDKLFAVLSPRYVWRLFGVLPIVRDETAYFRDTAYATRAWKIRGADEPARALAAVQPGRVFAYRWDWDEQPRVLWADLGELIGAAHGLEIAFVFGHWNQGANSRALYTEENSPGRKALSAAMQSYWAEFARSGDPGRGARGELPAWTAWDEAGDKYIVLDTEAGGGIRMARETETLEQLIEAIGADGSYADAAERCAALALIHRNAPEAFGAAQFAAAASGSCAAKAPGAWLAEARR